MKRATPHLLSLAQETPRQGSASKENTANDKLVWWEMSLDGDELQGPPQPRLQWDEMPLRAEHTDTGGHSLLHRHKGVKTGELGASPKARGSPGRVTSAGSQPQQWLQQLGAVTQPGIAPVRGAEHRALQLLLHPASSGERKEVDGLCWRESSKGKAQEQAPNGLGGGGQPSRFYSQHQETKPNLDLVWSSRAPHPAQPNYRGCISQDTNPSCSCFAH